MCRGKSVVRLLATVKLYSRSSRRRPPCSGHIEGTCRETTIRNPEAAGFTGPRQGSGFVDSSHWCPARSPSCSAYPFLAEASFSKPTNWDKGYS